jgi:hypothetical protein
MDLDLDLNSYRHDRSKHQPVHNAIEGQLFSNQLARSHLPSGDMALTWVLYTWCVHL